MSLQQLKREDLLALANKFEVEVSEENNKKEILAALAESNITFATYKKFFGEAEEEPAISFEEKKIILKMDRQNGSFEAFGVTFTRAHPFAIVSEELAQQIIDTFQGFRLASPAEAKSFYE